MKKMICHLQGSGINTAILHLKQILIYLHLVSLGLTMTNLSEKMQICQLCGSTGSVIILHHLNLIKDMHILLATILTCPLLTDHALNYEGILSLTFLLLVRVDLVPHIKIRPMLPKVRIFPLQEKARRMWTFLHQGKATKSHLCGLPCQSGQKLV